MFVGNNEFFLMLLKDKQIKKEFWKDYNLSNSGDINEWGSCQYSSAIAMYKTLQKYHKKLGKKLYEHLEIKIKFDKINSIEDMMRKVYTFSSKYNKRNPIDELTLKKIKTKNDALLNKSHENKSVRLFCQMIITNSFPKDVDFVFYYFKSHSFDLWTATDIICKSIFENFKIEGRYLIPSLNLSEGSLTGLRCFILKENNIMKDESCFKDFDT